MWSPCLAVPGSADQRGFARLVDSLGGLERAVPVVLPSEVGAVPLVLAVLLALVQSPAAVCVDFVTGAADRGGAEVLANGQAG